MTITRKDVRGGTNRRGVAARAFSLPPGRRIRYDLPSRALRPYVTGYAVFADDARASAVHWFVPSPAFIGILLDAGPMEIRTLEGRFDADPSVSLYGPTSRAYRIRAHGGIFVGVGLSPLGWAAMTSMPASALCDRVQPLSQVAGRSLTTLLAERLSIARDDGEFAAVLDDQLGALFQQSVSSYVDVAGVLQAGEITTVEAAASLLDMDARQLLRASKALLGMSPKLVLRRARFLRSLSEMVLDSADFEVISADGRYHDASHFHRDANDFLGTTAKRFLAGDVEFLLASLRARRAVLGNAVQALHT